jgi:Fe-S cluster biogenesis protein NfuA
MEAIIEFLLTRFRATLREDGGDVQLQGIEDGVVDVRYSRGQNDECAGCVLTADQVREFLLESFQKQLPDVKDVRVTEEQPVGGSAA